ncbi:reprolysin-like metallopeptidase [Herpetosiphon llansteffanensis]|uniref:reprolysin-like metallopeptidase n=1 Tax=Herpetosiphon llansteffanensis TaxID=2094568 RepID=UPI000D7CAEF6|nr:zinc-dependent metalloprotease family protein [Herpetosiphon llansteffanensis]
MPGKRSSLVIVAALVVALLSSFAAATLVTPTAASSDGFWQDVQESRLVQKGARQIVPTIYRTVGLDLDGLSQYLAKAPLEQDQAVVNSLYTLQLPMPDGKFEQFRIVESPIMQPELAAKFPEIRTYLIVGVDTPNLSGRLDLTPAGFHGLILGGQGRIFIDPYSAGDTKNYIVYDSRNFVPSSEKLAERQVEDYVIDLPLSSDGLAAPKAVGDKLRTYRLAMAATGEYTAFHGGTVSGALAAITTSVNRVNAVYEREVAVRMVLVANNSSIIYTNASTDPYTNNNGVTMLGQNQTNIKNVIGNTNYDIGHVFSTGGGGVASLGSVCSTNYKAQGVTGSSAPVGDPFDIDYVAHEIGHQFGGNHTFNGTTGSCGGGNRASSAAYEPGSGSTIMAYAGICGAENLQSNSDPYFHSKSLNEITTFITTGGGSSCGTATNTGNTAPVANAGADYTIPRSTPFELSGTGSDANGDSLTYNWEQYNLGTAAPPNTDNGSRPIFRSFNPSSNPKRSFPKLSDILNNVSTIGESLPTTNRTLAFRLIVRDNRAGGGSYAIDTANVTVNSAAGPFTVTAPNTAVTWTRNSSRTITWNVANTTAAPVSCANVEILFSSNGGSSFSSLLASTPNDGSQAVTIPNTATTQARIKVRCANNVFFDLSNVNFTVN